VAFGSTPNGGAKAWTGRRKINRPRLIVSISIRRPSGDGDQYSYLMQPINNEQLKANARKAYDK
jgi:hypothetical protein